MPSWCRVGAVFKAHTLIFRTVFCLGRTDMGSAGTQPETCGQSRVLGCASTATATSPTCSLGLCSLSVHPTERGWSVKVFCSCWFAVKVGFSTRWCSFGISPGSCENLWWMDMSQTVKPIRKRALLSPWQLFGAPLVHFNRLSCFWRTFSKEKGTRRMSVAPMPSRARCGWAVVGSLLALLQPAYFWAPAWQLGVEALGAIPSGVESGFNDTGCEMEPNVWWRIVAAAQQCRTPQ